MRSNGRGKNALRAVDAQFGEMKRTLLELARIPGVSAPGFPAEEVRRSAQAFADVLRQVGIENVRILEVPGVHPYVYGEWLHVAAVAAYLRSGGWLPCNVKLLIEGEEEIGPSLRRARAPRGPAMSGEA